MSSILNLSQEHVRLGSMSILMLIVIMACTTFEAEEWALDVPSVGSSSSPKAMDLNKDGVLDIIVGAGAKEFETIENGVLAIDGLTGEILWRVPARNQIVGSPIFQDITQDSIPDVFIGGRSAIMYAIDGASGNVLWEYLPDDPNTDYYRDTTILNFYTGQWVDDLDNDGYRDMVNAYGGFVKAPAEELDRPTGYLMLISGKTGDIIAKAPVPDRHETYCSPVLIQKATGTKVIFGTGGENIDGRLYMTSIDDILTGNIDGARILVEGNGKGFMAPPIIVQNPQKDQQDVVVNSVDGRLIYIDGLNNEIVWTARLDGDFDTYTMPAAGLFTDDDILDYFGSYGKGAWPDTEYTVHMMVDGSNGQILFQDTLGSFQYASPLVVDFTGNHQDDIILCTNEKIKSELAGSHMEFLGTNMVIYPSGQESHLQLLDHPALGTNLGSTPLITDLDNDGNIDIVYMYMSDAHEFYSFKNLKILRKEYNIAASQIRYGSYME